MTLVEELRSKKSRDNRGLLDRAADRIEELETLNEELAEVASDIFEEIIDFILTCIENDEKVFNSGEDEYYDGRFMAFKIIEGFLVELKKKYTEDKT